MAPQLPVETSEAIIDLLIDERDVYSLRACSLACKAWIPRCRSHLFADITLSYDDAGRLSRFLDAVRSPTMPGQHVRVLSLKIGNDDYSFGDRDITSSWSGIPALPILAEHLTNVEVLKINYMVWDELDSAARTAILSGFQTVRKLHLEEPAVATFTQAIRLMSSFPSLVHLGYDSLNITGRPEDLPMEHIEPPPGLLNTLILRGLYGMKQMVAWFVTTECHVSNVHCQLCADEDLMNITRLLTRIGPSLKGLEIDWYPAEEEVPWNNTVDLSKNTCLRFLQLNCGGEEEIIDDYLRYIPEILSQIHSTELQTLYLDLWVEEDRLEDPIWGDIEGILGHPRFSSLHDVKFQVHAEAARINNVRNYIKQRMPNLAGRNIVKLKCANELVPL